GIQDTSAGYVDQRCSFRRDSGGCGCGRDGSRWWNQQRKKKKNDEHDGQNFPYVHNVLPILRYRQFVPVYGDETFVSTESVRSALVVFRWLCAAKESRRFCPCFLNVEIDGRLRQVAQFSQA